ncbi:MAG TPA: protein kinase [Planctomycetaceae bacterium]
MNASPRFQAQAYQPEIDMDVVCPECGDTVPPDSPGGLCPHCLTRVFPQSTPFDDPACAPPRRNPAGLGAAFVPPAPEDLATRFPQLEILELLGSGGMGAVYKARQLQLDRLVAVKILPQEVDADLAFAQRFTREARALAKLNHPNIVAIHDFGQAAGQYYILMEFVDGTNLRQLIAGAALTPREELAIVPQICDALQFAHDAGVVHRDIKPANILVDRRGRVKIADFGLAKLLGHEHAEQVLTSTHQVMGTLRYMAPEQMQGSREVDHRADIYSLGVVFYEMLTGELPVGRFAPPSQKAQMDARLDDVVLRSLEAEPDRRYQHASDVKTDVETIGQSAVTHSESAPGSPTSPEYSVQPRADANLDSAVGPVQYVDLDGATRQVRPASIGLLFSGVINTTFAVWLMWFRITTGQHAGDLNFVVAGLSGFVGLLSILGGIKMRRLEMHWLAVLATYAAMLPLTPGFVLVPYAIWARFVLGRGTVRGAFDFKSKMGRSNISSGPARASTREYVSGPSIGLICAAVVNSGAAIVYLFSFLFSTVTIRPWPAEFIISALFAMALLMIGIFTFIGALNLRKLQLYPLALGATIAAMLPCTPGCVVGLPCGIWALVVLGRPDVRAAFDSAAGGAASVHSDP